MTRLAAVAPAGMTAAQNKVFDAVTQGPRGRAAGRGGIDLSASGGGLPGPFNAWMYSPDIGNLAQELGAALRFKNSLPENLLELAVITVGRHWSAQFEFWAHARLARQAGVSDDVIEAIRIGKRPDFDKAEEAQIYDFVREMLDNKRVCDATYAATRTLVGEQGLVDLVTLMGYYTMISFTLNCFAVPVPEGQTAPFNEPTSN